MNTSKSTSNLNSAIIMGFFAASIGLIVMCFAMVQENEASTQQVSNEAYTAVSAEDVIVP